ncbi:MAG: ABC transporter substrate-binding protein, partial [bacterium]|nr:ABC transporter substrate-binding protein [bacterium]
GPASAPGTAPAMSPAAGSEATETSEPTEAPAGGEAGGTVSITHTQGTTEVPLNPERVVVLDFGVLDTISAIGAEDSVVGTVTATLPEWLDEYADATNVGTLQEPDLEALTLLDPDLVIVGFRSAAQYQTLSANWPTVDVTFVAAEGWQEGVAEAAGIIGQIYGAEEQVAEGIHELEREIESVSATIPEDNRTLVLSTSAGEVTTYGPASRFGLIYSVLGMDPALENVADDPHGQVISFETIAETNPDWIFVNDRDAAIGAGTAGQAAGEVLNTPLVTGTTAWTEDQVIYLDPARWYIVQHGLENSVEMVREIGEALTQ